MIARVWRGVVRAEHVSEYIDYIADTGGGEYKRTEGNLGAWTMSRVSEGRAEIVALSFWESWDAIRNFTGPDIEHQMLYPEDERYLLEPPTLTHYEVAELPAPSGRPAIVCTSQRYTPTTTHNHGTAQGSGRHVGYVARAGSGSLRASGGRGSRAGPGERASGPAGQGASGG